METAPSPLKSHSNSGANGSASKRFKAEDSSSSSSDAKVPPHYPINIQTKNSIQIYDNVFDTFTFKKVLKADPARKLAFVHGTFEDGKDAVVILEKTAFELDKFHELFGCDSTGVEEFQNDLYYNFRVCFESRLNRKH